MTADEFTIRQSEFADKHGLLPGEMKDLRNKWLKEGHGFKSIGRPIFLTPNAVKVLEAALATPETDETQTTPTEQDFKDIIARDFGPNRTPHPDYPSGNVGIVYREPFPVDVGMAEPPGLIPFDQFHPQGFDAAGANIISHITPDAVEEMNAKTIKHETEFGSVSILNHFPSAPLGEDAAHEVSAALAAARAKHSTHLTTAAQQADTLPEPEDEQPLEVAVTPENFSALVLKACKNKRFVYASFQGQKIAVQVHPRNQQKVIRKNIRVRAEKEGDATRYIHVP